MSRQISTSGGKQIKRRGLPGLQLEVDSERLLELLSTMTLDESVWREMRELATSIRENAQALNERISQTGSYALSTGGQDQEVPFPTD